MSEHSKLCYAGTAPSVGRREARKLKIGGLAETRGRKQKNDVRKIRRSDHDRMSNRKATERPAFSFCEACRRAMRVREERIFSALLRGR